MKHPIPLYSRINGDNTILPTTPFGAPMFSTAINRYTDELLYVDLVGNLRYGVDGRAFRPAMIKAPQARQDCYGQRGVGRKPVCVQRRQYCCCYLF